MTINIYFKIENGRHSFGSYAFAGSSKFGITLAYRNISGTIEAGISDPVNFLHKILL